MLSLSEATSAELDLADQQNKVVHLGWIQARPPGMRADDHPDLLMIDCGLPSDTFNVVCRARLNPVTGPTRIAAVAREYRRRERAFTWWVGPADRPGDLGFRVTGWFTEYQPPRGNG